MFSATQYTGALLPDKTLCFTFDDGPGDTDGDGPGPKTIRLAEYLHEEGIPATFFMTGRHIAQYPHLLQRVLALGHTIGNHTYNHPDFTKPETFVNGENMLSEITKTAILLKESYPNKNMFFRAPYGSWNEAIADEINRGLQTDIDYRGPIGWDINENDWEFWFYGMTAEACADAYFDSITQAGHGIVLMHDSTTDNEIMKANNRTYETIKILVPRLKEAGFRFVSLQVVPGIL